jgi:flagellar basal-body rod modification protein FlgD
MGAVSGAAAAGGAAGVAAASGSGGVGGALGQDTFLQLLVAEMQNQDPLNPMDSTTFVTQLAQFQMLDDLNAIEADVAKLAGSSGGTAPGTGSGAAAQGSGAGAAPAG